MTSKTDFYVHKGHFVQSKTHKLTEDYVIGKV